jgi:hypothetical protein
MVGYVDLHRARTEAGTYGSEARRAHPARHRTVAGKQQCISPTEAATVELL